VQRIKTVLNLFKKGFAIDEICIITGLSVEEIRKIIQK